MKFSPGGFVGTLALLAGSVLTGSVLGAPVQAHAQDSKQLLSTLLEHEEAANEHRGRYTYVSEERSDRTDGRLWQEKVVETQQGRVRFLLKEDGQPLSADRIQQERGRLAQDALHPEDFARREAAQKNDEEHAKQMLQLLPKAFLFDPPAVEGLYTRIRFRPNPDYQPQSIEERVLHGMTGSVLIDRKMIRLREVAGNMPEDVSLGFGPFAIIRSGSNFSTQRLHADGNDWKTETVHTDINGKALFMKNLARKQEVKRWGYKKIGDNLSVSDAVTMAEQ